MAWLTGALYDALQAIGRDALTHALLETVRLVLEEQESEEEERNQMCLPGLSLPALVDWSWPFLPPTDQPSLARLLGIGGIEAAFEPICLAQEVDYSEQSEEPSDSYQRVTPKKKWVWTTPYCHLAMLWNGMM